MTTVVLTKGAILTLKNVYAAFPMPKQILCVAPVTPKLFNIQLAFQSNSHVSDGDGTPEGLRRQSSYEENVG